MRTRIVIVLLLTTIACRAQVETEEEVTCGGFKLFWDFRYENLCYRILPDAAQPSVEVSSEFYWGSSEQQKFYADMDTCYIPSYVIHDSVSYMVIGIGEIAFEKCSLLRFVHLSPTIRYIDQWAFASCHALEEVVLPDSLVNIKDKAFMDCYNLKKIHIPEGTAISKTAFLWTPYDTSTHSISSNTEQ